MASYCSEELLSELEAESGGGGGTRYRLVSFISHFGNSIDYGHYVAYCRSDYDQQWYEYDDARVTQVSDAEVASKEAYVLFYELKTTPTAGRDGNEEEPATGGASVSEEQADEPASDEDEWASAL